MGSVPPERGQDLSGLGRRRPAEVAELGPHQGMVRADEPTLGRRHRGRGGGPVCAHHHVRRRVGAIGVVDDRDPGLPVVGRPDVVGQVGTVDDDEVTGIEVRRPVDVAVRRGPGREAPGDDGPAPEIGAAHDEAHVDVPLPGVLGQRHRPEDMAEAQRHGGIGAEVQPHAGDGARSEGTSSPHG